MNRISPFFLLSAPVFLLFISCNSNGSGNAKDVNPESIYFDYRVWGAEENDYITVRLQYKFEGENGTTLLLENPSKVELDGVDIKPDSSKMNGVYYEVTKPLKEFAGQHTIVFTDMNGKEYKEEFSFHPISLKTHVPDVISRDDLAFDLDGLAPKDYVKVMLSDTASFSEGIDRVDTVKNGHVIITKADLRNLVNGHINLEFSREHEKRVKNRTKEGGKLSIYYELKREFELRD